MDNKTNTNWVACIYDAYQLNLYRMVVCENLDLASFNKREERIEKIG